jgi:enoyl-CoA hydratase/carnithine racemase
MKMPDTADSLVQLRREGAVAELVLNRSEAANSLSTAMLEALAQRLDELAAADAVRVVILAASGRVFSAGMDLKEARSATPAQVRSIAERLVDVTSKLRHFRGPVIAKVRGMASAAGLELVLACDLAYAASSARFATPGVNVGMWCMTPMVPLVRAVAPRHAAEMLLRGEPVDAAYAERIGLINRCFDESELDERVARIAADLAAKSPFTLALGKRALHEQSDLALPEAYSRALAHAETNAAHPDAKEGMSAFVEKRAPKWSS